MTYQPGSIVAFSGSGFTSQGIRWRTGKWWLLRPSLWSHVGLIVDITAEDVERARYYAGLDPSRYDYVQAHPPGICLLESTTMLDSPCLVTGKAISGVQCNLPGNRIKDYKGRVATLEPIWPLTEEQRARLAMLALMQCGTPYDGRGVALIGTVALKYLRGPRAADRSSLFCSELAALNLWRIGLGYPKSKPGYASPASVVQCHERFTHGELKWET